MSRLILHIGTHETGTTTIQRFAHAHREQLFDRGLLYPDLRPLGAKPYPAHHDLADGLAGHPRSTISAESARMFISAVREQTPHDVDVLISGEPFYRHRVGHDAMPGAGYWLRRKEYVRRVRECFPGDDVEVLVVLRRQDQFANSAYNEHIKVTRYHEGLGDFLKARRPHFDYARQLQLWSREFPAVRALVYDDLVADRDGYVSAFFASIGRTIAGLEPLGSINQSLPLEVLAYKREMNQSAMSNAGIKRLERLIQNLDWQDVVKGDRANAWVEKRASRHFFDSFAEGNETVRRKYTGLSRPSLFPDADAGEHRVLGTLTPERRGQISAAILDAALVHKAGDH